MFVIGIAMKMAIVIMVVMVMVLAMAVTARCLGSAAQEGMTEATKYFQRYG